MTDRYIDRQLKRSAGKRNGYIPDSFISKLTDTLDSLPEVPENTSQSVEQAAVIEHSGSNITVKMAVSAAAAFALLAGGGMIYSRFSSQNNIPAGSDIPADTETSTAVTTDPAPETSSVSSSVVSSVLSSAALPGAAVTGNTSEAEKTETVLFTEQSDKTEEYPEPEPSEEKISYVKDTDAKNAEAEKPEVPDNKKPEIIPDPHPVKQENEKPAPDPHEIRPDPHDNAEVPQKPEKNPEPPAPPAPVPNNPKP